MSLISRNSPRRTRAKKDHKRVEEVSSPTLGPVVENIQKPDTDHQKVMLDEYSYKQEPEEPVQLNRSQELDEAPEPEQARADTFNLYDLSFFCEERIYNILWMPQNKQQSRTREIQLKNIQDRLEVYSEYSQEVTVGSFKDTIHFYSGEVLIPEEFLNISGFMRKYFKIETVHVLYETGEILKQDAEYCNFWMERANQFFEPREIPVDRPMIIDEEICLDCDLKCVVRHRKQMIN